MTGRCVLELILFFHLSYILHLLRFPVSSVWTHYWAEAFWDMVSFLVSRFDVRNSSSKMPVFLSDVTILSWFSTFEIFTFPTLLLLRFLSPSISKDMSTLFLLFTVSCGAACAMTFREIEGSKGPLLD